MLNAAADCGAANADGGRRGQILPDCQVIQPCALLTAPQPLRLHLESPMYIVQNSHCAELSDAALVQCAVSERFDRPACQQAAERATPVVLSQSPSQLPCWYCILYGLDADTPDKFPTHCVHVLLAFISILRLQVLHATFPGSLSWFRSFDCLQGCSHTDVLQVLSR